MITIKDLKYRWSKFEPLTLDIAEFTVAKNEKVFLQGASGSGKTTLISIIGGVFAANEGAITIKQTRLNELEPSARDRFRADHIGFIFQQFNLLPYLSVAENIIIPCQFSRRRKNNALNEFGSLDNAASRLLNELGLTRKQLTARSVNRLSVGQQQRVAAARALIGSPQIVIADEPTSALDTDAQQDFLQLLFDECKLRGITLLFVSHNCGLAGLFDRTVNMNDLNRVTSACGTSA